VRSVDLRQSDRLASVAYDVRGPVLAEAMRLESQGHKILRLNIGNPAPFGFDAPDEIVTDMARQLARAQGYSESKGVLTARRAVVQYHQAKGVTGIDVEDVWLGNGVSELITMTLQALLNPGDEVLIPAPDYPLWTAITNLCGGRAVHYLCDETADWLPALDQLEAQITDCTRALVVINPNNPTGAVYPRPVLERLVELARKHGLLLLADEIYDQIVYDDTEHVALAALAPDVLCMTFNGLSKAYRVAGYRAGWVVLSGPTEHAQGFREGLTLLANMRLCPNVPAQYGIQAALGGPRDIQQLILPGGRLHEQRDHAYRLLNAIPGVSCTLP
jgi:alanine-synthesizing transaminase